ncbi:DUF4114 domain-containing protein [Corallococcus aberystwythensis]|uniref:DUF4114 domain-containing protein n=1 Tax=Corallococcus aberystwythensis TaxID=2316722 RepID=A0A3A8PSM1_9BACT|nr:DUF4114 domain-containing protein [Corallococcus aberystwythensis]RKH59457.1 DUF4114 domain-containing protein [Corallococcus aberystwythensis]
MRAKLRSLAALALLTSTSAAAQATPALLCQDDLAQDRQPPFSSEDGSLELDNGTIIVKDEKLQLNTNLTVLNSESIKFPFDQNVTISYVFESAGASHALGFMYLEDVKNAGYLNAAGNLRDDNGNGIYDLHEDIYNLAPSTGTGQRPFVGKTVSDSDDTNYPVGRRCTKTFTSGGLTYTQPALAMNGACDDTFVSQATVPDPRPGHTATNIKADVVGKIPGGNVNNSSYSDYGLYPHIPNLLEPPAPENGNKGIGKMVFLLADDDSEFTAWRNLPPVADVGEFGEGIPDYDVSKYDFRGIERSTNPDPGVTPADRTVNLGQIQGGKEVIFFLVVYYDSPFSLDNGTVYPCLKMDPANGKCLLHLRTPTNVFFSKSAWNMDQNFKGGTNVAERNIGCAYEPGCNPDDPKLNEGACKVADAAQEKLCGWLEGPKEEEGSTLWRLKTPFFGNLDMPMEKVTIPRPGGVRNPMAHVIVGAPTTDPFRWILGFEDLPGGGDRDFNDVVFVINKENGGGTRSATVSQDIQIADAEDFTITKVRFNRQDDSTRKCSDGSGPPCWTEASPGACQGSPEPTIRYSIALDCRNCSGGTCNRNPLPTWIPLDFEEGETEVEIDLLGMGFTGSQLCWKVDISSPNEFCQPVIDNVDVGYQAVRSGSYARASPSSLGNAIVWGVNETPGTAWGDDWPTSGLPDASVRAYDGRKDFGVRGRIYFKSLYDPESPTVTNPTERWEAGRVMSISLGNASLLPEQRNLYTTTSKTDFTRTSISALMATPQATPPPAMQELFPDSLCDDYIGSRYPWDLNNDGICGTPSITTPASKKITDATKNDRQFMVDWLYGWEDHYAPGPANVRRAWPVGGINLSTVALAVPPYKDTWYQNAQPTEQDQFRNNFMGPLASRETVAYVGTMSGALHAFRSGAFRNSVQDGCVSQQQYRGYFMPAPSCGTPATRDYGSGKEIFSFLPFGSLSRYRNQYATFLGSGDLPKPSMDASASIANVDFGNLPGSKPAWTWSMDARDKGAKTVLVSATGKTSPNVFALDITDPTHDNYPLPLWEFSLADTTIADAFRQANLNDASVVRADTSGSRFAPSVSRLSWGPGTDDKAVWTAVVGTDYKPADTSRAGALYLINMKTGKPLDYGTGASGKYAGVITLDKGYGVAAESALVDLNKDGTYDVIYVPTTAGHVYRINLGTVTPGKPLGQKISKCMVADAPTALKAPKYNTFNQNQDFQQIHSNMALNVVSTTTGPVVRFYFGTSDNPDLYSDGPPNKDTAYHYYLLGYEDSDPSGTNPCATLTPMWARALEPGQTVWGGVALSGDQVFATTAVGKAADICNLDATKSGKSYATPQSFDDATAPALLGSDLGGHGISAPIVHDEHLFVITATGEVKASGDGTWNHGTSGTGAAQSRTLLWEAVPDGKMPKQ